jgi:hypothetical protein
LVNANTLVNLNVDVTNVFALTVCLY